LQYALETVMAKTGSKKPPFVIVRWAKLGGQEMIRVGSDIIFVARLGSEKSDEPGRLAVELMELLSGRTEDGVVFHTDARLRPDGEKGLLVNTIAAYEQYYRQRSLNYGRFNR